MCVVRAGNCLIGHRLRKWKESGARNDDDDDDDGHMNKKKYICIRIGLVGTHYLAPLKERERIFQLIIYI